MIGWLKVGLDFSDLRSPKLAETSVVFPDIGILS